MEITTAEGDTVPEGKVLLRQDSSQLEAQYAQARAAVIAAQANLARVVAPPQDARVSQAQAQVAQAQAALQSADTALADAQKLRANQQVLNTQIDATKAQIRDRGRPGRSGPGDAQGSPSAAAKPA